MVARIPVASWLLLPGAAVVAVPPHPGIAVAGFLSAAGSASRLDATSRPIWSNLSIFIGKPSIRFDPQHIGRGRKKSSHILNEVPMIAAMPRILRSNSVL